MRKVAAALLVAGAVAVSANARGNGRQPCDRGAGGVSHCQGDKFVCKDMDSCDEARHYLTRCGVRSLDRDGDGVPCESLCGVR